eukprot:2120348-Lingulodinium_polyedra.AAC.1
MARHQGTFYTAWDICPSATTRSTPPQSTPHGSAWGNGPAERRPSYGRLRSLGRRGGVRLL